MTSKNSWFSLFLIKDCFKRTLWAPALYFVALFFALPVSATLSLQALNRQLAFNNSLADVIPSLNQNLAFIFGTNNGFLGTIFILAAFVSSLTVFYYLHRKKRIDFFHSLPIRRESLFVNNYLSGILFILIPYIINLVLAIVAVATFGYASYLSLLSLILAAFQHLLLYVLIYTLGVFAAMLTGNLVIHGLFLAFLLVVGPAFVGMYQLIMEVFYPSFYTASVPTLSYAANTSPLGKYIELLMRDYLSGTEIIFILLAIIIIAALALYLYKKRPSDSAGQAISFAKAKPFIKYLITFVVAIYMGFIFHFLGDTHSYAWLFFGIICGGIIISRIIEIIYAFDFHAIKKNLLPLGIFLAATCSLFTIPIFDLTGYNSYFPAQDELTGIKLNLPNVYYNVEERNYYNDDDEFLNGNKYLLTDENNLAAAYQIAKAAYQNRNTEEYDSNRTRVIIGYQLESGKTVYRNYNALPIQTIKKELAIILSSQEFKNNFYHLNQDTIKKTELSTIRLFENSRGYHESTEQLTDSQKQTIVASLQKDILNMSQQQLETMLPIGKIYLAQSKERKTEPIRTKPYYHSYFYTYNEPEIGYPIYACYTNTLNALVPMGITESSYLPQISHVDYIIEYQDTAEYFPDQELPSAMETMELGETKSQITETIEQSKTITDAATIQQIMNSTFCTDAFDNHPFLTYQSSPRYSVYYKENTINDVISRAFPEK